MARKSNTLYQLIMPIKSDSTVFDDIPGLNKDEYLASQIGDALTISEFLRCNEHSVVTCAKQGHRLKGCSIKIWKRYFENIPFGVLNTKTGKLKDFDGVNVFTVGQLSKILHYSESYITNMSLHNNVGKRAFKDEKIVRISNAKIRHYDYFNGKEVNFYAVKVDNDDEEYIL